jgi:hypothetical protein
LSELCLPATHHEVKLKADTVKHDERAKELKADTVTQPSPATQNRATALAVQSGPDGVRPL